jgi:hypothetical protein
MASYTFKIEVYTNVSGESNLLDMRGCCWKCDSRCSLGLFGLEDEGNMILSNVRTHSPNNNSIISQKT